METKRAGIPSLQPKFGALVSGKHPNKNRRGWHPWFLSLVVGFFRFSLARRSSAQAFQPGHAWWEPLPFFWDRVKQLYACDAAETPADGGEAASPGSGERQTESTTKANRQNKAENKHENTQARLNMGMSQVANLSRRQKRHVERADVSTAAV